MTDSEAFKDERLSACRRVELAYPHPPPGWLKADGRFVDGTIYKALQKKIGAACRNNRFQIPLLCPVSDPPDMLVPGDWVVRALVS